MRDDDRSVQPSHCPRRLLRGEYLRWAGIPAASHSRANNCSTNNAMMRHLPPIGRRSAVTRRMPSRSMA